MGAAIAVSALLLFGLLSREHRVNQRQSDVVLAARARRMAIADTSCQRSIRLAPNDSVRASIVDQCVQLIIARERVASPK